MLQRWPAYPREVATWWRAGPLRGAIERAEAERESFSGRPRVLAARAQGFETRTGIEGHSRGVVEHLAAEAAFTVLVPDATEGSWPDFTVDQKGGTREYYARQPASLHGEGLRVEFKNSPDFQARVQAIIAQGCL